MPDINMQVFEEVKRNQLVTEVDIQTQVALDDYQVQLSDIANPTQSQDNVVIDRHGEFLSHWNESLDFDTWVKTSIEIAGKRLLVLRGNSNVSSISNGDNVFIQYSGYHALTNPNNVFENNNIISPSNVIYEGHTKIGESNANLNIGLANTSTGTADDACFIQAYSGAANKRIIQYNEGSHTIGAAESPFIPINTFVHFKIVISSTVTGYVDDNMIGSGGDTIIPNENMSIFCGNFWSGATFVQDWAIVRKYIVTEPTWLIDGAERNIVTALKLLGRAG